MLHAIETSYKGYRFRSRLEARWAVFFDALGIRWEYEKQGYNLGVAGLYLPDFEIHGREQFWVEIKGQHATPDEQVRANELAMQARRFVFLVWGTPGVEVGILYFPGGSCYPMNRPSTEIESQWCRLLNLCQPTCSARALCRPYQRATQAARSARFEHGERPR